MVEERERGWDGDLLWGDEMAALPPGNFLSHCFPWMSQRVENCQSSVIFFQNKLKLSVLVGTCVCEVLKLQVSPSLSPSLRDRLSNREEDDYTNFYSELLPLNPINQ